MTVCGSSPRMRRTVEVTPLKHYESGIISAHAENSGSDPISSRWWRDHLRACGEQAGRSIEELDDMGSSPRMRRTAS